MPQLKSGRHFALSASPYLDAVTSGTDESKYFAIAALCLHAPTPDALRAHVVVVYFVEGEGTPPNAPSYDSGYCVGDILAGSSDWSPEEVEEFSAFVTDDPRMHAWLQAQHDELNQAIRDNSLWSTHSPGDDLASNATDADMIKRAVILRSAMAAEAMAQLRNAATGGE